MTEVKNSQNATKSSSRHYDKKRRQASRNTRDTTLSIRLKSGPFSNIDLYNTSPTDLPTIKTVFFNDKSPPDYNRDHWLRKLMVCQYVLQSEQTDSLKSYPFVLRFNHKDQQLEYDQLKRKIRDTLKKALGEVPLYWLHFEYNTKGKVNLHCNGEILINPDLVDTLENALQGMYGRHNAGCHESIDFPMGSRQKTARQHGLFYAVYNWPGYGSKEERQLKKRFIERTAGFNLKSEDIKDGKHYAISAALNSKAKQAHRQIVTSAGIDTAKKQELWGSW